MATVRNPSSVAARKTRMAISLRLATRSFRKVRWGFSPFTASSRRGTVMSRVFIAGAANYSNEQIPMLQIAAHAAPVVEIFSPELGFQVAFLPADDSKMNDEQYWREKKQQNQGIEHEGDADVQDRQRKIKRIS